MIPFRLVSEFEPTGDQPQAITELVDGLDRGERHQVLLGVTGSGKTFTIANVVARTQRPTLVLAHNKTLAAQLHAEFFPEGLSFTQLSHEEQHAQSQIRLERMVEEARR